MFPMFAIFEVGRRNNLLSISFIEMMYIFYRQCKYIQYNTVNTCMKTLNERERKEEGERKMTNLWTKICIENVNYAYKNI